MKKLLIAVISVAVCGTCAFAATAATNAGTATAQFLKLGAGARAAGMGGAFAGMADDSTSIYWNPAGLTRLEGKSLSMMHALWFEDMSYDWLAYAMPVGNIGVFGLAAQYMSYGSMTKMDGTGLAGDTMSPADMAVSLSYAKDLGFAGLGINLKYISSKIVDSATAYCGDIGLMRAMMNDRLHIGLAVQNVGTKMKFIDVEDPLPMNVKLGGAYAFTPNWKVALDANAPVDDAVNIGAGTEYLCKINETMNAAGRLGYNTETKDTGGLNGVSAGVGFTYLSYTLDYAFVPYGDLGNTQRVSLSVRF